MHYIKTMCIKILFRVICAVGQFKMWFCETTNTSNMKHVAQVFLGGLKSYISLWYIRYTVGFYKPELCFYHVFLGEFQTELHTNKWAKWFESSSVKWLQFTPFSPCASVEVKRINVTGLWETAASDWPHSVLLVNVQSCIVFAKECVDYNGIYLPSHSTVGIILDEYKPAWGGFQKHS